MMNDNVHFQDDHNNHCDDGCCGMKGKATTRTQTWKSGDETKTSASIRSLSTASALYFTMWFGCGSN
jgi:hypothetical protein